MKPYILTKIEQGSEEWLLERQKYLTPSKLFTACCGGVKAKNKILRDLLLPPKLEEQVNIYNFIHGKEFEKKAVEKLKKIFPKYSLITDRFLISQKLPLLAGSPDVCVVKNRTLHFGIEIKAPIAKLSSLALKNKILPEQYLYQIAGYCLLTGVDEWLVCIIDKKEKLHYYPFYLRENLKIKDRIIKTLNEFQLMLKNGGLFKKQSIKLTDVL